MMQNLYERLRHPLGIFKYDPLTATAAIAIGGGAVMGAIGNLQKGEAAQQAANYNAQTDMQNASMAEDQGRTQIYSQQRSAAQTIGAARAQYSASGIDSGQGSALDVLEASATQAALDSSMIKYNSDVKAYGYRRSAALGIYEGDQAKTGSYYSAAGSLLSGAGQIAGKVAG